MREVYARAEGNGVNLVGGWMVEDGSYVRLCLWMTKR